MEVLSFCVVGVLVIGMMTSAICVLALFVLTVLECK